MASGFLKRGMNYLGLVEDESDEDMALVPDQFSDAPVSFHQVSEEEAGLWESAVQLVKPVPTVQSIQPVQRQPIPAVSMIAPRMRRAASTELSAHVHAVTPTEFADATQIADSVMRNQPVIVNLQVADRALKRRMIDFCNGVACVLRGGMERVANDVYLVTPSDVELSADERQPWQKLA